MCSPGHFEWCQTAAGESCRATDCCWESCSRPHFLSVCCFLYGYLAVTWNRFERVVENKGVNFYLFISGWMMRYLMQRVLLREDWMSLLSDFLQLTRSSKLNLSITMGTLRWDNGDVIHKYFENNNVNLLWEEWANSMQEYTLNF